MSASNYRTAIATNRFGLGALPGELQQAAAGEKQWLKAQLGIAPSFDPALPNTTEAIKLLVDFRKQRKEMRKKQSEGAAEGAAKDSSMMMASMNSMTEAKEIRRALTVDSIAQSIKSNASFSWRLLHFFSNHFSVSGNGTKMSFLAPLLEKEAIAPHLFGQFEDMLIAVISHPSMLIYLNNEKSFGPNSSIAKKRKDRGLNENLARELLELHTLGVNGGYRQADVIELAKAISGWSVSRPHKPKEISQGAFHFRQYGHEPGARTILGVHYSEAGVEQGKHVLRDLARHPATAHFISTKIARQFGGDKPAPALIARLTKTWLKTNGNLTAIYTTLIDSPEPWLQQPLKFKTPVEFFISASRAFEKTDLAAKIIIRSLTSLGQAPFTAGSPAGFDDSADSWNGADALFARIEWSALAAKQLRRADALAVANHALGASLTKETRTAIARAESQQQAIALLLMSPEFQRR